MHKAAFKFDNTSRRYIAAVMYSNGAIVPVMANVI